MKHDKNQVAAPLRELRAGDIVRCDGVLYEVLTPDLSVNASKDWSKWALLAGERYEYAKPVKRLILICEVENRKDINPNNL